MCHLEFYMNKVVAESEFLFLFLENDLINVFKFSRSGKMAPLNKRQNFSRSFKVSESCKVRAMETTAVRGQHFPRGEYHKGKNVSQETVCIYYSINLLF